MVRGKDGPGERGGDGGAPGRHAGNPRLLKIWRVETSALPAYLQAQVQERGLLYEGTSLPEMEFKDRMAALLAWSKTLGKPLSSSVNVGINGVVVTVTLAPESSLGSITSIDTSTLPARLRQVVLERLAVHIGDRFTNDQIWERAGKLHEIDANLNADVIWNSLNIDLRIYLNKTAPVVILQPVHRVEPTYPALAQQTRIQGTRWLRGRTSNSSTDTRCWSRWL